MSAPKPNPCYVATAPACDCVMMVSADMVERRAEVAKEVAECIRRGLHVQRMDKLAFVARWQTFGCARRCGKTTPACFEGHPNPKDPRQVGLFDAAEEAKQAGIAKAVSGVDEEWLTEAANYVEAWARTNLYVTCEAVRAFARGQGFVAPRSERVWAEAMRRAKVAGHIVYVHGQAVATDPKVHKNRVGQWRSLICTPAP